MALVLVLNERDFNGCIMTIYLSRVMDVRVKHVMNTVSYNEINEFKMFIKLKVLHGRENSRLCR